MVTCASGLSSRRNGRGLLVHVGTRHHLSGPSGASRRDAPSPLDSDDPMRTFAKDIPSGMEWCRPQRMRRAETPPSGVPVVIQEQTNVSRSASSTVRCSILRAVQHIVERIPQPFILQDRAVGDVEHLPGVTVIEPRQSIVGQAVGAGSGSQRPIRGRTPGRRGSEPRPRRAPPEEGGFGQGHGAERFK